MGAIRIGLDVGGTFTDVVALDETTGATSWTKVLTDVESPSAGVLAAIDATGVDFRDISEIRRTHRQALFDLDERVPEPLVPRELRLEVDERVDANGGVVRALD